jgi:hypothetical protein
MLLIAIILIELSYIGFQTVVATTKAERLRMAAESGVEKAVEILKDREGVVPSSPGNRLTYSSPDGELKYAVEIYEKDKQPPYEDMFYITSNASTNDGKYYKSYVVRISKESFKSNFFTESLCMGGLTIIGKEGSSFDVPENCVNNFKAPLYLQCDNINIKSNTIKDYRTIAIKAKSMTMDSIPYDKYLVYADIPESNFTEINSLYSNYIKGCRLDYYNGIAIKSGATEDKLFSEELFMFKRLDGSNISLMDLESVWRNAKCTMALVSAGVDTSIWQKLSPDSMKQISDYIRENTAYKLVIIKGSLIIPDGEYNNYIICCSGKVKISGNVKLNNASILCTDFNMDENSSLSITCPLRPNIQNLKKKIAAELKSSMSNYSDGATVKFISWYDL